jgi:hypothetical protein
MTIRPQNVTNRAARILLLASAVSGAAALAQSSSTFTAIANMTTARSSHTATLLLDGRVLIAGGDNYFSFNAFQARLATAELYDPATQTFTAIGNMTTGRSGHTATLLPDGRVLIAGGDSDVPESPSDPPMKGSAELYDPSTQSFTATGNMLNGRAGFNATLLTNGEVLIDGGVARYTDDSCIIGDAELYDPSTGTFTPTGPYAGSLASLVTSLEGFPSTSTPLAGGTVLFVAEPTAEVYDPITGAFSLTGGGLPYLEGRTATLLMNGAVLAAGGEQEDTGRFDNAELYDPAAGVFTATGAMTRARAGHTATPLPDGTAFMAGGESQNCSANFCEFSGSEASTELYNPATGTFGAAGNMTTRRELHTATLLNSGDILLTGGMVYGGIGIFYGSLGAAELYHPALPAPAPVLGAVWHSLTGQLASSQNPAIAGEILSMDTNGLPDGGVTPPQVAVGGRWAETLYFGIAPGYPGYHQVNFRVPDGVAPGSAVYVRLLYLGRASNPVTIGVK